MKTIVYNLTGVKERDLKALMNGRKKHSHIRKRKREKLTLFQRVINRGVRRLMEVHDDLIIKKLRETAKDPETIAIKFNRPEND